MRSYGKFGGRGGGSVEARHVETLTKMRAIVDAATNRDARAMATRCRDFVHRSARFADKVLSDQE